MKAEEAYKKSSEVKEELENKKLKELYQNNNFLLILNKIKETTENGDFAVDIKNGGKEFDSYLIQLGYHVEHYGNDLKISWLKIK